MQLIVIANNFQEDYIYNLLNSLSEKVENLILIGSSKYDRGILDPRINILNFRDNHDDQTSSLKKLIRILNYYKILIGYLIRTPVKIVHVQWLRFPFVEGILLTLLMIVMGKKVVYTAHNPLPHHKNGIYYRTLFRLIYLFQKKIVVHTHYIKKQIANSFNINPDKIHVIKHGVYSTHKTPSLTMDLARTKLGLRKSSKVILFFGKIVAYKGFDLLVESIDQIEDEDFEILVAGKVLPSYKDDFESLVANRRSGSYKLLIKYLSEEEVELCFKAADVTVLPYREASQSGVLFMSYAHGTPVIAPDMGGFSEDIIPSKTGYLFKANSPESLAQTLLQFKIEWADQGIKEEKFIMDFAEDNYAWNATSSQLIEIYKHL